MKNKYDGLPTKEQLTKYRKANKILLVSAITCTVIIVAISVMFFVYNLDKSLAIGFLLMLPFSWWIGYYLPKKENNKKIKELEKNQGIRRIFK